MQKGCYIFESHGQKYILSLKDMVMDRLNFVLKSKPSDNYLRFFGLNIEKREINLEKELLDYFLKDYNYSPQDIHPVLQGDNLDIITNYPELYSRIIKIKVTCDSRNIEEITSNL